MNLTDNLVLFLDTETGGLDAQVHSLLSIGFVMLDINTGELGPDIQLFIKEREIVACDEALSVNHIDLNYLKDKGISPYEAHQSLYEFITNISDKKITIGGINIDFDLGFIKRLPQLEGSLHINQLFSHRKIDLSSISKAMYHSGLVDEDITSSKKLFNYYGIPQEGRHDALFDAKASATCYLKMITRLSELSKVKM